MPSSILSAHSDLLRTYNIQASHLAKIETETEVDKVDELDKVDEIDEMDEMDKVNE